MFYSIAGLSASLVSLIEHTWTNHCITDGNFLVFWPNQ